METENKIKLFEEIYRTCNQQLKEGWNDPFSPMFDDDDEEGYCKDCGAEIDEDDDLCDKCAEIRENERNAKIAKKNEKIAKIKAAMGNKLTTEAISELTEFDNPSLKTIKKIAIEYRLNWNEVIKLYDSSLDEYTRNLYIENGKLEKMLRKLF
jgi:hypothetical protein